MAAKGEAKIRITLDDGSSILVTKKKFDALNKTTDKAVANQQRLVKGSNTTKRGLEGVGQRANNTSKDFSRMSQGMGGLVQVYATVAANVFALSTAFTVLKAATNFQDMISSARNLSAELGTSFLTTADSIRDATKAQIDFKTALRAANKASASGISAANVTKFAEAAAKSAQTFGGTTTDALNRMVTAILQGETELLKEVGIVISSNEAFLQYGITIGKAANQLTSFEKRQALSNAVLKESDRLFAGTDIQVNNYEVLAANVQNAAQDVLEFVNNSAGLHDIVGVFANSLPAMAAGVGLFAASIIKRLRPSVDDVLKTATGAAAKIKKLQALNTAALVAAQKKGGVKELGAQQEKLDKKLAQARKNSQKIVQNLIKEGKLKESAIRKGSTLDKIRNGEDISPRGAAALTGGRGKSLRATSDGLTPADSKEVTSAINDQAAITVVATKNMKNFTAAQDRAARSSKSFAASLKVGVQQFRNTSATTKAAVLTATQGVGVWKSYGIATGVVVKQLALLEKTAKKTGVAVTFMQKAGVKAAAGMALLGKAMSSAFTIITTLIIVWETAKFVLDALGISLGQASKAQQAITDATEEMNTAFEESSTTLDGMIKSFERFKALAPDLLFQKTAIATGNFVQELGSNFSKGLSIGIAKLRDFELATKLLAKAEKDVDDNSNQQSFGSGRDLVVVTLVTKELTAAKELLAIAETEVFDATVSSTQVALLNAKAFIRLRSITEKFTASGIKYPLLDKLKATKIIVDTLGNSAKGISTLPALLQAFEDKVNTLASAQDKLKKNILLGDTFVELGLITTGAGKAVEELGAKLVLFAGTNTRLQKSVFKSEGFQNYVELAELAAKALKSLAADGKSADEGIIAVSKAFGVTTGDLREFVKEFNNAIRDAGQGTLDRNVQIDILKNQQKGLDIERKLVDKHKESLSLLKEREALKTSELQATLANARARAGALEFTVKQREANEANLVILNKQITASKQAATAALQGSGSATLDFLAPQNINKAEEEFQILLAKKQQLEVQLSQTTMTERELTKLRENIVLQEKALGLQKEGKKVLAFVHAEMASIRQNTREIANLGGQILTGRLAVAKVTGDILGKEELSVEIAKAQIERKKLDLALDMRSLESQRTLNNISIEKFEREKKLFALRAESIRQQEIAANVTKALDSGRSRIAAVDSGQAAGSTLEGTVGGAQGEQFSAIMVEGARRFVEHLNQPGVIQIVVDGAFGALDAGFESLVQTLGTGQDDTKALLKAINDSLRDSVVKALNHGIKGALLQILAGDAKRDIVAEATKLANTSTAGTIGTVATLTATANTLAVTANGYLAQIALKGGTGSNAGAEGSSNAFSALAGALMSSTGSEGTTDTSNFAAGGVVNKPTFSLIGEGKNSEAVVPLPNNREIPVRLEGGTGEGQQITNNYDFSGADAATETRLRGLIDQSRQGAFDDVFSSINRGGKFAKMSGRR